MPSENPARRLSDIFHNVARIRRHVAGYDLARYADDEKTIDAVERCIQRITEAARKLGPSLDTRYPDVPWKAIRDMGSVLRHDYDEVLDENIRYTATQEIDALEQACEAELARLGESP